jgi:Flp pilus assembly protein TadG
MIMNKKSESGQAIVLLVLAVIVLIGFTGLAIDGGMVYSDRRHAQSASDAASLAGGGFAALALGNYQIVYQNFDCSSYGVNKIISDSKLVATNRALSNDYSNAEVTVTHFCQDNGSLFDENYIDFTTTIVRSTRTALIHVVYKGPVENTVESTVRVRPQYPLAFGNAIVAMNDDECEGNKYGVSTGGSSVINVIGGGVFTNGCFDCDGLSCPDEEDETCVDIVGGTIGFAGSNICDRNERLNPNPEKAPEKMPTRAVFSKPPDCNANGAASLDSITGGMNLNSLPAIGGGPVKLVCLTSSGNAIKITNVHDHLRGTGITLYLPNSGDIDISGGLVELYAPDQYPDPSPGLGGILIYVNPENSSKIKINGNSESKYLGMIYAPNADVEITGSGTIPEDAAIFNTQIVAQNVTVGGGAYIDIKFDNMTPIVMPSSVDLTE